MQIPSVSGVLLGEKVMTIHSGIKVFQMGESLVELTNEEEVTEAGSTLFLTASRNLQDILRFTDMNFEGEANIREVGFSKIESQQECLWGSLFIPSLVDVTETKYRILFFINRKSIVIADDYGFSGRIIQRIRARKNHQADTKERFLYNFLTEIITGDQMALAAYEKNLMAIEEKVVRNNIQNFQSRIVPIRSELLTLQEYYDELRDLGRELEEDENEFFDKKMRKYFGVFSDRADRLMNKAAQLLEYAEQVKDDYQTAITAKQNRTMQFLTIISTIFMPLTLITSWYGMNFENMPELQRGYPFVIILSLCVVVVMLLIFKFKKLL